VDSRLLQTKLHAPPSRQGVVARPRLVHRLSRGVESKLTLVSAPPGFGKSTLVGDWVATRPSGVAAAWLSLDAEDNDPATFWSYVVGALQTAVPTVGASALSVLGSPQLQTGLVLTALLNDLAMLPNDIVLVLDDFHVIDRPEVHEGVAVALDRLPPTVHVVIATRADPPLPLSRLRARGELVEIRAADLRFTPDEAADYLRGTMGLELAGADIVALEERTEGWIAALQLAALSLRGRDDVESFIASFAGDDRYVVDYLADEVLARQPEETRRFLLHTSILDRLTGALCDAVTGRADGRAMLEALDRANLFLVALDEQRRWYRYHHLFADVLRARLSDEQPDAVARLHRRASDWFERHGERSEAIRHAMAAGDFPRAADLIELAIPDTRKARQETTLRRWLEALPEELFDVRPVLATGYVGALMSTGEFERVDALLAGVERWLNSEAADGHPGGGPAGMVVVDQAAFHSLPGAIEMYRAAQARIVADVPGTMAHARRALELVAGDDHLGRGGAATLLGLAYWTTGDLEAAYRWCADGVASLEKAGHLSDVVGIAVTLADIRIAQGRLRDAMHAYERGLELALSGEIAPLRGAADMHVGMCDVLRERNELQAATDHLRTSRELGDENGLPKNPYRWRVAAAGIRQAQGDLDGALQLLDQAEPVYFSDFSPDSRPVAAMKARILIIQGRLTETWGWARSHRVTPADEPSYVHQFELATLARLLLAEGTREHAADRIDESTALSEQLVGAAKDGGWNGALIDALIVQSLARHASDDLAGALPSLARAIELAEPEGHVRIFVDEGPAMSALLEEAVKRGPTPSHIATLRAAFATAGPTMPPRQPLVEPLSGRELEVLRLLTTELSGPEIARHLVVSLNTVRTHTKSIFSKLGVSSRRAAVRRAAELELLASTSRH
jgi:LuxR family maltose regulon positive regulatory protein